MDTRPLFVHCQLNPSVNFLLQVYQTSQGYFVVTPEKRRRDSSSHQRRHSRTVACDDSRPMLMSTEEALAYVHGEMQTIRDGAVTHQAVQTNLADVICGGESPVACLMIFTSHETREWSGKESETVISFISRESHVQISVWKLLMLTWGFTCFSSFPPGKFQESSVT
jgi:hypothetical protein